MKKFYYIVGAVVTAMAVFGFVAIMLKKIKVSLSIEAVDDVIEEDDNDDITLTIENDDSEDNDDLIKEEIETLLDESEEI